MIVEHSGSQSGFRLLVFLFFVSHDDEKEKRETKNEDMKSYCIIASNEMCLVAVCRFDETKYRTNCRSIASLFAHYSHYWLINWYWNSFQVECKCKCPIIDLDIVLIRLIWNYLMSIDIQFRILLTNIVNK